jgi:hypothetical protein
MSQYDKLNEDFPEFDLFDRMGWTLVRCPAMMAPDDDENQCQNLVAITQISKNRENLAECKADLKAAGWLEETLSTTYWGPGIPYDPIIYAQCPIHKEVPEEQLNPTELIKETAT